MATSLVAVSTAKSSNEFERANITADFDYLTMGTSLPMTATGKVKKNELKEWI